MRENILSWNIPNWITVLLMVGVSYAIFGAAVRIWQQKQQNA